jgi:hypothetical protein
MWKPAAVLLFATPLLGACERYTEQTSPCFGRNGTPVVSQAAFSFPISDTQPTAAGSAITAINAIAVGDASNAAKDCDFEDLSRPA